MKIALVLSALFLVSCKKKEPDFFYVAGQLVCEKLEESKVGILVLKDCFSLAGNSSAVGVEVINPTNILKIPNIEVK